jgi:Na+/glutamate symporter
MVAESAGATPQAMQSTAAIRRTSARGASHRTRLIRPVLG